MQSHMIQRMIFELNTDGSKTGLESEKKANEYHREIIVPAVEECFRDIDATGRPLIIDSLEIDLGVFTSEGFEREAKKRLVARLTAQLSRHGRERSEKDHSGEEYDFRPGKDPGLSTPQDDEDKVIKPADTSELYYRAFTSFLNRGRFPWWFVIDHGTTGNEDIEKQFGPDWIGSLGSSEKSELKQLLQKSRRTRIRLAATFETEWTGELLHQIGLAGREALVLWTFLFPAFRDSPQVLPVFRQYFWTSWIMAAGKENRYPDLKSILERVASRNTQLLQELSAEIRDLCRENSDYSRLPDRVSLAVGAFGHSEKRGAEQVQKDPTPLEDQHGPDTPEKDRWQKADIISESPPGSEGDELSVNKDPVEDVDQEEEAVFIQAAGLVLLHPFLSELFEKTELWDGRSWLFGKAPFRAAHLLSYLTYGDDSIPEYRLLFHKIMAGLELETVLPAEPALNPAELLACDELLEATIHHWEALRNTTPDGLREVFLQREGKITASGTGYRLHIEKRTEDILLSRLPWGYSMIHLPWMNVMLNVSWI